MTIGVGTIGILHIGELVGTIGTAQIGDGAIPIMVLLGVGILGTDLVGAGAGILGMDLDGAVIILHTIQAIMDITVTMATIIEEEEM